MTDIEVARIIFYAGVVLLIGAGYYAYTIWRDDRLDAEDEKRDRVHGEKHA